MKAKRIRQLGVPNVFIIGAGLLILVILVFYLNDYNKYLETSPEYIYNDPKSRDKIVSNQEIYDFMNFTLFNADSLLNDKREFLKLNCFTVKHGENLRKFINSQPDTILTSQDKMYMKSQFEKKAFLWDPSKLINVWCLMPTDIAKLDAKDGKDYWEKFREYFGNYGHHHYSIPLFNKDRSIAIIEHHGAGAWLLGSGGISVYRKENGKWKFLKDYCLWIS